MCVMIKRGLGNSLNNYTFLKKVFRVYNSRIFGVRTLMIKGTVMYLASPKIKNPCPHPN